MRASLIVGLSGENLTEGERDFLRDVQPAGLIVFARNCIAPDQIRRLIGGAVEALGHDDVLVLIDQEGGRVRRLRPPQWREMPSADAYARLALRDRSSAEQAARLSARLTADDLRSLGINTNCAPVLDLRVPGAHDIIGDRAYGCTPGEIEGLGRAVAEGYMQGGVVPVIKHIPGHGRAMADSHFELPVVDATRDTLIETDFAPFASLADLPAAMTAHVVYSAIDAALPASTSALVTSEIIRGHIGFDGLLMSDDLGMKALSGSFRERAEAVIAAGSDVALHCSGSLDEMQAVAAGVPALEGRAAARFAACVAVTRSVLPFDRGEAEAALTVANAAAGTGVA